jgi:hypothetical protein
MASPGSMRFSNGVSAGLLTTVGSTRQVSGHEFTRAANPLKGTGLQPLRALASRPENDYHFLGLEYFSSGVNHVA